MKRYLSGRRALGTLICEGSGPDAKPNIEIVGVVSDFSYRGIREESEQVFFPLFEGSGSGGHFYVRVREARKRCSVDRAILREADPALPIIYLRTLDEQVNRALNTERLLYAIWRLRRPGRAAIVGRSAWRDVVCGDEAHARNRPFGPRRTRSSTLWLVLRDAVLMITAGMALALPSIWALGRLIESQLFGVKPTDAITIAVASLILAMGALGAALIPAYRASKVNPTDALRFE